MPVRWHYFLELKTEADALWRNLKLTFKIERPEEEDTYLGPQENEYDTGL